MRDLIVLLMVFGSIPIIIYRPYFGIIMWSWIGYMSPHRLTYGFAYSFPFGLVIAIVTIVATVLCPDRFEKRKIPWTPAIVILALFVIWMSITTQFAFEPKLAHIEWMRVLKIQLAIFLTLYLINTKDRLNQLVWIIVLSIGFYGVKGGLFAIATGGNYRVWGPDDTFISGNNELAIALVLIIPLVRYLQLQTHNKWIRRGLFGFMGLCTAAVIASYSRGAFISLVPCFFMMIFLSKHRKAIFFVVAIGAIGAYSVLPQHWFERMDSIGDYQEDASMQGRYDAWYLATWVATDHPLTGGGYRMFTFKTYEKYNKEMTIARDAHSIYFEVLGEHGFIGLILYLLLNLFGFLTGGKIKKLVGDRKDLLWAKDLAIMLQIAMICWAIGGAFKGMAYWDLPYHYIAIMVIAESIIKKQLDSEQKAEKEVKGKRSGIKGYKRAKLV